MLQMNDLFQAWDSLEEQMIVPGYHAKFIHTENMTFALWRIEAGEPLPDHSHPHEQVSHLLEGEFELTVEGVARRMTQGMVAVIPPYANHSGRAYTDCRVMDVFSPRREDYVL